MVKYTVEGRKGKLKVDIPKEVDEKTKDVIIATLEECMTEEYEKQALKEIDHLLGSIAVLVEHMKKDKSYNKDLEELIRELTSIYLTRGLELGKELETKPNVVLGIIQREHPDIKKIVKKLPKDKQWLAEYILHSIILGKQCYEAGLAISALLSLDKKEEYLKKLEKETNIYIG